MDAIASLRENIGTTRWLVDGTMQDIPADLVNKQPGGTASSIGALYAHVVVSEDMMINGLIQGKQPLAASTFAGKTGLSEMPPMGPDELTGWFKGVQVDLTTLQAYAKAVREATDAYLASAKPEDLDRKVEFFSFGPQTVNWIVGIATALHVNQHIGEISVLKGLAGLKGYPV